MPDLEQAPVSAPPTSSGKRGSSQKLIPILAVLAGLGLWAWVAWPESADDRMAKQLERGRALVLEGRYRDGVEALVEVMRSDTLHVPAATAAIQDWISPAGLKRMPKEQAAAVVDLALDGLRFGRPVVTPAVVVESTLQLVEHHGKEDAKFAMVLLTDTASLVEAESSTAFKAKRREVLEALLAKHPQDIDVLAAFAQMLEQENDADGCKELLTPFGDKLGDSEAARILGLIRAQDGDLAAARTLLGEYCDRRLAEFSAANTRLADLWSSLSAEALEALNRGSQSADWYARYEKADPERQNQMVNEAVDSAVRRNPEFRAEQKRAANQGPIVRVALTLGVVMLRRAQSMAAAARKVELEAAEKVFLAIRSAAGQTSQFRLSYGQILYWLGKAEDGRLVLDEFLVEAGRSPGSLIVVSRALRSVGADAESRKLAEEAYELATDPAVKHDAAATRALLQRDLDDRILWLERSNPADKNIQASLATARGRKFASLGEEDAATKSYRRAANLYASFPKSSAVLNNAALTYQALFEVSGNPEDLRQASTMLQEAQVLTPGESVILGNAARTLIEVLVMDLLGDAVDWSLVREAPDLGMLSHLYNDQAGKDATQIRLAATDSYQRSLSQLQQCALLSPKNPRPYVMLLGLHIAVRKLEALAALRATLDQSDVDLTDMRAASLSFYAGENEERDREAAEYAAQRAARALTKITEPTTSASIAVDKALSHAARASILGADVELDPLVGRAEKIYAARPSEGLRSSLIGALLWRASRALAKARPEFAKRLERCRRTLTPDYSLLLVAERDAELRAAAKAQPDVQRAVALVEAGFRLTPDSANSWRWAILRQFKPAAASALGAAAKQDSVRETRQGIQGILEPLDAAVAVDRYWQHLLAGEEALAMSAFATLEENNVPLPIAK